MLGVLGWTPHSTTPKLWCHRNCVAGAWFLRNLWHATRKSMLLCALACQTCGAENRRLTYGAAAPALWQSVADNQALPLSDCKFYPRVVSEITPSGRPKEVLLRVEDCAKRSPSGLGGRVWTPLPLCIE
ncbi:unnamed protein product [Urochloa humidicola]